MILTTTSTLQGKEIVQYYGIVSSETIIAANYFRDLFTALIDTFGGRSTAYEKVYKQAKHTALREIIAQAREIGANAIIGVDLDYQQMGKGILMVAASGTAVKYK